MSLTAPQPYAFMTETMPLPLLPTAVEQAGYHPITPDPQADWEHTYQYQPDTTSIPVPSEEHAQTLWGYLRNRRQHWGSSPPAAIPNSVDWQPPQYHENPYSQEPSIPTTPQPLTTQSGEIYNDIYHQRRRVAYGASVVISSGLAAGLFTYEAANTQFGQAVGMIAGFMLAIKVAGSYVRRSREHDKEKQIELMAEAVRQANK